MLGVNGSANEALLGLLFEGKADESEETSKAVLAECKGHDNLAFGCTRWADQSGSRVDVPAIFLS